MALEILAQDIIIDETTDLQDDDVDSSVAPHNNSTVQYLLGLDSAGGLTSPEVAFKADFVQVTATEGETITSIILAQDSSGTPFSTTEGVNSGIQTVDGNNYVWLFQDPNNANVVRGVIGTSDPDAEPAEGGPLAFSFALISTSNGNADLYTVQYVPLLHPDADNPDDQIDLTDQVFASAAGTISVSFTGEDAHPGSNEFNLLSSPDDASKQVLVVGLARSTTNPNSPLVTTECNVSQQGFGVDNQSINPDSDGQNQPLGHEVLQVDFVTGGTDGAGDSEDIAYDVHVDNITQAGFIINQLTPSTPSGRVDIKISAFDVTGNEQGDEFFNGSPTVAAPITSLTLTGASVRVDAQGNPIDDPITADGTYATAKGNVTVSGFAAGIITITGLDNVTTVDITTSSQMDRLHVEAVNVNEGLDITEIHFSGQTTNAVNEDVGSFINFDDDGPSITVEVDYPGTDTSLHVGNAPNQTNTGSFGYDLGSDSHNDAFYTGGGSDFTAVPTLTGTVDNSQNPDITDAVVTKVAEDADSASFDFTFKFDSDPITAGVQQGTAGGTLSFNKNTDEFTVTITDSIDGFSFDILHTNELVDKQPTGNTGHPEIVVEQLTPDDDPNPFFVQFTSNSTTKQIAFGLNATGDGDPVAGDTIWSPGQFVTNNHEDWVSATQSTNGVAGDTIQKGELLTLRFFEEDILGDVATGIEKTNPTTTASGLVIKFDGIGNSEDLVLILDLIDANGDTTTRSINVQNTDLIKGNANIPPPYNTEFTLDNNDALLILEQNDYNDGAETYQIQGVQIMQSANSLTGTDAAIDLDGATGTDGDSSTTLGLTTWDPLDQDVLKIVDIGFVQQTTGTIDASLDFSFALADADLDETETQHIAVNVSNDFIV